MVTSARIETKNTLHLLAAAPSYWPILIPQVLAVWQEGDLIVLLAQGAHGLKTKILHPFNQIAVLDADLARLGILDTEMPANIKIATTADWATWTMQYQRTVTWR
jgi:hypothetical protein